MTQFSYTEIVYAFLFDAFVMQSTVVVTDIIGALLIAGSLFTVGLLRLKGRLN